MVMILDIIRVVVIFMAASTGGVLLRWWRLRRHDVIPSRAFPPWAALGWLALLAYVVVNSATVLGDPSWYRLPFALAGVGVTFVASLEVLQVKMPWR